MNVFSKMKEFASSNAGQITIRSGTAVLALIGCYKAGASLGEAIAKASPPNPPTES